MKKRIVFWVSLFFCASAFADPSRLALLLKNFEAGLKATPQGQRLVSRFGGIGFPQSWEVQTARALYQAGIGEAVEAHFERLDELVQVQLRENGLLRPENLQKEMLSYLSVSWWSGSWNRSHTQTALCAAALDRENTNAVTRFLNARDTDWYQHFQYQNTSLYLGPTGGFENLGSSQIYYSKRSLVMNVDGKLKYFTPPLPEKTFEFFRVDSERERILLGFGELMKDGAGKTVRGSVLAVIDKLGNVIHRVRSAKSLHWVMNPQGNILVGNTPDNLMVLLPLGDHYKVELKESKHRDAGDRVFLSVLNSGEFVVVRGYAPDRLAQEPIFYGGSVHFLSFDGRVLDQHEPNERTPARFGGPAIVNADGSVDVKSQRYGRVAGFDAASATVGVALAGPLGVFIGIDGGDVIYDVTYRYTLQGNQLRVTPNP